MTDKLTCGYVIYIQSSPDKIWHALTDGDSTAEWWGHRNVSDWQVGSTWEHRQAADDTLDGTGTVLESVPAERLVMTFPTGAPSKVTFEITQHQDIVRLTLTHEDLADPNVCSIVSNVWPALLSNLKSLMETGHVLPQSPVEMLNL